MEKTYVRRAEAAELLGVSTSTLDRWVKEARIKTAEIGRPGVWFDRADLDPLIVTPAS